MTNTFTRRAPSGHVVTAEMGDRRLSSEVTGVRFAGSSYGRAFQIGTRGFHDDACRDMLKGTTTAAITVGRNEVRIATAADGASSIATLVAPFHELMTVFNGPAPTNDTIAGLFSVLEVADTSEGMVVRPSDATLLTPVVEHVMLVDEQFDSLDMPGPAHARANLPRGRGRRTRKGGEMWRTQLPGTRGKSARDYSYVVGFPQGLGQVMPGPDGEGRTDEDLLDWVDGLTVTWHQD